MSDRAFEEDDKKKLEKAKKGESTTPMLDLFGRNLNDLARQNKLDPVIGRDVQIEQVIQVLNKRKKNNVLIIGESGVGKSCLAEGIAIKIVNKEIDRSMWDKVVFDINVSLIVSGTKYRGEFENRMKELVMEIQSNPNIILFIDELHTMIGAGGTNGGLDASNIMKPALARGDIRCMGAMTIDDHKKYMASDEAFDRRFQKVWLNPPSKVEMLEILNNIKPKYEEFHGVEYDAGSLSMIIDMCDRYIPYRHFPDKAIDVMDEVGSFTRIHGADEPDGCKELEDRLKEIVLEKMKCAQSQRYEDAAKMRDEQRKIQAELDVLYARWKQDRSKLRIKVRNEDIAAVLSKHSGIPLTKIAQSEKERLMHMEDTLNSVVIGQEHAIKKIVQSIKRSKMEIQDPNRPYSFLFLGKTGTGKTFLAKTLAKYLFDLDSAFIRLDMSEYMEKFNVNKLIGSPPGYVGYDDKGYLTEKVKNTPYCILLLDEIEKAHPDVFNILLQVLDDGRLTDSHGSEVSFKHCIVIMTSNIGTKELSNDDIGFDTGKSTREVEDRVMTELKKAFRPELLNRIDEKIVFRSLTKEDCEKIIALELNVLAKRLADKKMTMTVKPSMVKFLLDNGFDEQYGARPLKRMITTMVENEVAQMMLEEKLGSGDAFSVHFDTKKQKVRIDVDSKK